MADEKKLTNAILVIDDSVKDIRESFLFEFLKEQGFKLWKLKDYPECNWIYVSLNDKTYMPGIPGIPVTTALGNHSITVEEFMDICEIYEKYNGLEPLCTSRVEDTLKKMYEKVEREDRLEYFKDLSYEEYLVRYKNDLKQLVGDDKSEDVIDTFMKKENEYFKNKYKNHVYPEIDAESITMLYECNDSDEEDENIIGVDVFDSVDLVSQTLDVSLDVFNKYELDEEGNKCYAYRIIAEDEITAQCIDIDLEDTTTEYMIAQTYLALDEESYDKTVHDVYSWGRIEFFFYEKDDNKRMAASVFIGEASDEENKGEGLNVLNLEFDQEEIAKFKAFLLNVYKKMRAQS